MVESTTQPEPCKAKLHTFDCGCKYLSPPCKCLNCYFISETEDGRFPVADTNVKHTRFEGCCRKCALAILEKRVDEEQQWRDYLRCESSPESSEMVAVDRKLARAREDCERRGTLIESTWFDYAGLWTRVQDGYGGLVAVEPSREETQMQ